MFSSLRPRIGKKFDRSEFNQELNKVIEEAHRKIVDIGREEKRVEINETCEKIDEIHQRLQKLPFSKYKKIQKKSKKAEEKLLCTLTKNLERKVRIFRSKRKEDNYTCSNSKHS